MILGSEAELNRTTAGIISGVSATSKRKMNLTAEFLRCRRSATFGAEDTAKLIAEAQRRREVVSEEDAWWAAVLSDPRVTSTPAPGRTLGEMQAAILDVGSERCGWAVEIRRDDAIARCGSDARWRQVGSDCSTTAARSGRAASRRMGAGRGLQELRLTVSNPSFGSQIVLSEGPMSQIVLRCDLGELASHCSVTCAHYILRSAAANPSESAQVCEANSF